MSENIVFYGQQQPKWWQKLKLPESRTAKLEKRIAELEKRLKDAERMECPSDGFGTITIMSYFLGRTEPKKSLTVKEALHQIMLHCGLRYVGATGEDARIEKVPPQKKAKKK